MANATPPTKLNTTVTICQEELRDPLASKVIPFLVNPGRFRVACRFTLECYNHNNYLEDTAIALPQIIPAANRATVKSSAKGDAIPVAWSRIDLPKGYIQHDSQLDEDGQLDMERVQSEDECSSSASSEFIEWKPGNFSCEEDEDYKRPAPPQHRSRAPSGMTITLAHLSISRCPQVSFVTLDNWDPSPYKPHWRVTVQDPGWIQSLTLSHLPHLMAVGTDTTLRGHPLKHVVLENLPSLTRIGRPFLKNYDDLETVRFENLPLLEAIQRNCVCQNYKLTEAAFVDLPNLTYIGEGWLEGCPKLTTLTLKTIGHLSKMPDLDYPDRITNLTIEGTMIEDD